MDNIVSAAGVVLDFGVDSLQSVGTAITGTPILLFATVCGIAFIGVTLFKRLLSVNM